MLKIGCLWIVVQVYLFILNTGKLLPVTLICPKSERAGYTSQR